METETGGLWCRTKGDLWRRRVVGEGVQRSTNQKQKERLSKQRRKGGRFIKETKICDLVKNHIQRKVQTIWQTPGSSHLWPSNQLENHWELVLLPPPELVISAGVRTARIQRLYLHFFVFYFILGFLRALIATVMSLPPTCLLFIATQMTANELKKKFLKTW